MQTTTRAGCMLALLLLGSCRSEQARFSFRSEPTASVAVASPAVTPPHLTPLAAGLPSTTPHKAAPQARPTTASPVLKRVLAAGNILLPSISQPHPEAAVVKRPRAPLRHDTLHIVLGGLLVVGGVVAGLALGGWLGLGVGALVVLLGYYFVVLGIGGKHAWLEIFQEFFNM
ncbi:hypothetical protein [Hymenobacter metallilatus]|uniref:Uncharacterized protein n=1 Tax=Hymenobacter metallilatus TaxID=2493666 RepID=A0A3R9N2H1_9BACT|nr:hypothetical protein [Hymenobacter metallilatus]RSK37401.1 hypothetical protein EI290_01750 [Hymenobacter metallilatus]